MDNRNLRSDFYGKSIPYNKTDFVSETKKSINDHKFAIIFMLMICLVADAFAVVELVMATNNVLYWLAPALLALCDLLFLLDVMFLINLRYKYTIIHIVLFVVFSAAFAALSILVPALSFINRKGVSMTMNACIFVGAVQAFKLFLLILASVGARKKSFKNVLFAIGTFVVMAAFTLANYTYGYLGQNIGFNDKECTLVFTVDDAGTYRVESCLNDGNSIIVPKTFNGKNVVSFNAEILQDTKIVSLRIESEDLAFDNIDKLESVSDDLSITVSRHSIDNIRKGLFGPAWKDSNPSASARSLFDRIAPYDLDNNETYYNISYGGTFSTGKIEYINTVFKSKNDKLTLADIEQNMPKGKDGKNDSAQYLKHTDTKSQVDLKWCYDNNESYIVNTIISDVDTNNVEMTFEKVYRVQMVSGNDKTWFDKYGKNNEYENYSNKEEYVAASGLSNYYKKLPTRVGFEIVSWDYTTDASDRTAITSFTDSLTFAEYQFGSYDIYLGATWKVIPPTVERIKNESIVYGESRTIEVGYSCDLAVTFTLERVDSEGNVLKSISTNNTGKFELNNYHCSDTGEYRVTAVAEDSTITSLSSAAKTESFNFIVSKKALNLEWTLPDNEQYTGGKQSIGCQVKEEDIVDIDKVNKSSTDIQEMTKQMFSLNVVGIKYYTDNVAFASGTPANVINADNYTVTAVLTEEWAKNYMLSSDATNGSTRSFSIQPKPISIVWKKDNEELQDEDYFSYTYNGEVQGPEASTEIINNKKVSETDEDNTIFTVTGRGTNAKDGRYKAVANVIDTNYVIEPTSANCEYYINKKVLDGSYQNWWDSTSGFVYSGANQRPTIAYTSGCGIVDRDQSSFSSQLSTYVRYNGEGDKINQYKNVGSYRVYAEFKDDSNYRFDSTVIFSDYEITQKQLQIVGWNYDSIVYNGKNQHPVVSGLDSYIAGELNGILQSMTYTTYQDNSASVELAETKNVKSTKYLVKVSLPTDSNYYLLLTEQGKEYSITPYPVEIVWTNTALTYNKQPQKPTTTIRGVELSSNEYENVSHTVTGEQTNANTDLTPQYTATVSLNDNNYKLADGVSAEHTFTINPYLITITWEYDSTAPYTYNATEQCPGASWNDDENNSELHSMYLSLTIDVSGGRTNAGTYWATASVVNNTNYAVENNELQYKINKMDVTASWTDGQSNTFTYIYNRTLQAPMASVSGINSYSIPLSISGAQIDSNVKSHTDSYTATIIMTNSDDNNNYNILNKTRTFVINPYTTSVDWSGATVSFIYNKNYQYPLGTASGVRLNNEPESIYLYYDGQKINANIGSENYTIIAQTEDKNYELSNNTCDYHISPKIVTMSWSLENSANGQVEYNGKNRIPVATVTNYEQGDILSVSAGLTSGYSADRNKDVGTFTFTATQILNKNDLSVNTNYTVIGSLNEISDEFTIYKKALTIAINNHSIVYGDSPANNSVMYTGFVNNETANDVYVSGNPSQPFASSLIYSYTYSQYGNIGDYIINCTYGPLKNYDVSVQTGTLTVLAKEVSISWSNLTFTYDRSSHKPSAAVANAVNGDVLALTVDGAQTNVRRSTDTHEVIAHTATVTGITGDKAGNYVLPSTTSSPFTIMPKVAQLTWDLESSVNGRVIYNGTNRIPTASINNYEHGDEDSLLVTVALNEGNNKNVGLFTYRAVKLVNNDSEQKDSDNYTLVGTSNNGISDQFEIQQKALTITVSNHSIVYGDALDNDTLGYGDASYDGFISGETAVSLNLSLEYSYDYVRYQDTTSGNTFDISCTPGTLMNYNISVVKGTLTVNKRTITINWGSLAFTYDGNAHLPTASAGNVVNGDELGLTVVLNGDAQSINVKRSGTTVNSYTAKVNAITGDLASNYAMPAEVSTQFFIEPVTIIVKPRDMTISYGDAVSDYSYDFYSRQENNGSYTGTGFVNNESDQSITMTMPVFGSDYVRYENRRNRDITMQSEASANNYNFTYATATLTVNKRVVDIVWDTETPLIYNGTALKPIATASNVVNNDAVTLTVTVDSSNKNAGIYEARVTGIDNSNYRLPVESDTEYYANITGEYIIQKREITITWTSNTLSLTYNGAAQKPTATAGNVVKTDGTGALATTGTNGIVGLAVVTASDYVDASDNAYVASVEINNVNYRLPSTYTTEYFITKKVLNASNVNWGTDNFTYNGAAQGMEPTPQGIATIDVGTDKLSFVSTNAKQTNVSRNTSTHGVQSYQASITGIAGTRAFNYKVPSGGFTHYYWINPVTVTITADNKSITYGDAVPAYTCTYTGFVNNEDSTVLTTAPSFTCSYAQFGNAASYQINVSGAEANNYNFSGYTPGTLTVSAKTITVDWSNTALTYNGTAQKPTATLNGVVNNDTFTSTITGGTNAGQYDSTLTISGGKSANYVLSGNTTNFEISKKIVTVSWSNTSLTYDGTAQKPTAEIVGLVGNDSATLTVTGAQIPVGNYSANVTAISNNNYRLPESNELGYASLLQAFSIAKRTITILWGERNFIYDQNDHCPTATAGNLGAGDTTSTITLTVTGAQTSANTGYTATVTEIIGTNASNYALPAANTTSFDIAKKLVTFEWASLQNDYDNAEWTPTANVTNPIGDDQITLTVAGKGLHAGDYSATIIGISNDNYRLPESGEVGFAALTQSFTISPKLITIIWTDTAFTYDGNSHKPTANYVSNEIKAGDSINLTVTGEQTNARTAAYTATANIDNGDYTPSTATKTQTFTIAQREITITWGETNFVYDGNTHCPTATAGNLGTGDTTSTIMLTVTGAQTNANTYTATVSQINGAKAGNYKLPSAKTCSFTIEQKEVSIIWGSTNFTYNGSNQCPTATAGNLVEGDAVTLTVSGARKDANTTAEPSYTAEVTGISGTKAGNYKLPTETTTTYTISPLQAQLSWTAPGNLMYNKTAKVPTVVVANKIEGDTVTVTKAVTSGNDDVNVGTFTYEATGLNNSNYTLAGANVTSAEYTITPLPVQLIWTAPANMVYDKSQKVPTVTVGNLCNGDTVTVTSSLTDNNDNVNVGSFTYTVTGLNNNTLNNYTLDSVNVTSSNYVITAKSATITVTVTDQSITYGDAVPNYNYTVSGMIAGDNITTEPTLSCNYTQGSNAGSYAITASGAVNSNYAFSYVNGTLTVEKANRTAPTVSMNGWTVGESASTPSITSVVEESSKTTITYYYGTTAETQTSTVKPTTAGSYYVKAVLSESTNYKSATSAAVNFVINAAPQQNND